MPGPEPVGDPNAEPAQQDYEATVVFERQPILTIPDLSRMTVELKVPEGYVKRISIVSRQRLPFPCRRTG